MKLQIRELKGVTAEIGEKLLGAGLKNSDQLLAQRKRAKPWRPN